MAGKAVLASSRASKHQTAHSLTTVWTAPARIHYWGLWGRGMRYRCRDKTRQGGAEPFASWQLIDRVEQALLVALHHVISPALFAVLINDFPALLWMDHPNPCTIALACVTNRDCAWHGTQKKLAGKYHCSNCIRECTIPPRMVPSPFKFPSTPFP